MAAACTPPMEGVDSCVILQRWPSQRCDAYARRACPFGVLWS